MLRRVLLTACVLLALTGWAHAQVDEQYEEAPQDMVLMEVGAASSISSAAARPMQEVAQLLVEARQNIARMQRARQPYNVVSSHIKVRRHTAIQLHTPAPVAVVLPPVGHIQAQLTEAMEQPTIHDPHRFGTKYPIRPGRKFVTAEILGEDGKPYLPRKQWKGITGEETEVFRSPFAKFIHPPAVASSADVANKDPNTQLTPVERKTIDSLQFRLKRVLDKLGANIVWDHTNVKNRRLIAEFDALKVEARTLMEEYELRTGVKTISWQLQEEDRLGMSVPTGRVTDIHFAKNPELQGRPLQRPGDPRGPPEPTERELQALKKQHADAKRPPKPKEQRVSVKFQKGKDGFVRAKVGLRVVDSKVVTKLPANLAARPFVPGKKYASGRVGSPSKAVQIDVIAPFNEKLVRERGIGQASTPPAPAVETIQVNDAPKINL